MGWDEVCGGIEVDGFVSYSCGEVARFREGGAHSRFRCDWNSIVCCMHSSSHGYALIEKRLDVCYAGRMNRYFATVTEERERNICLSHIMRYCQLAVIWLEALVAGLFLKSIL